MTRIRVTLHDSGELIAEGPVGWGITPFERNLYISGKYLKTRGFKVNYFPGFCPYKFLYVWLDLHLDNGDVIPDLGWKYWLPNPLLPFIWFRIAIPRNHPSLVIEEFE